MAEFLELGAEVFAQEFGDVAAQGLVARAGGHGAHDGWEGVAVPVHGGRLRDRIGCAKRYVEAGGNWKWLGVVGRIGHDSGPARPVFDSHRRPG